MAPAAGKSRKRTRASAAAAPAEDTAAQDEAGPSGASDDLSAVVYIGHLPHGFYEKELLGYFSQFGKLKHVRLSRSKKTGKAKHYAFLEFAHPSVAQIAAEAMDGYFMFAQRISCRVLRASEVHPELWRGANRKFKVVPWQRLEQKRHNKQRTPEQHARRVAGLVKRDEQRKRRIAAAGMDYEYPGLSAQQRPAAKKVKFE